MTFIIRQTGDAAVVAKRIRRLYIKRDPDDKQYFLIVEMKSEKHPQYTLGQYANIDDAKTALANLCGQISNNNNIYIY